MCELTVTDVPLGDSCTPQSSWPGNGPVTHICRRLFLLTFKLYNHFCTLSSEKKKKRRTTLPNKATFLSRPSPCPLTTFFEGKFVHHRLQQTFKLHSQIVNRSDKHMCVCVRVYSTVPDESRTNEEMKLLLLWGTTHFTVPARPVTKTA